jgi:uncharacterized membrane protein (DUF373 family)
MLKIVDSIVHAVVLALLCLLSVAMIAGTFDLVRLLWSELVNPPIGVLDVTEILELLGFFLMVLIVIEMIYVVRLYAVHRHLDVQAVLAVALIAIARKVIVFDFEKYEATHMLGIAAIVMALAGALFLLRRGHVPPPAPAP